MPLRRTISVVIVAGAIGGLLVLGVGGRFLMRLLAFTTPESPRFSWLGLVQILGAGVAWGMLTAPLIIPIGRRPRLRRALVGPIFGALVLALAVPPFFLLSGFDDQIVAPPLFLWLSGLAFPVLFMFHGVVVHRVLILWRIGNESHITPAVLPPLDGHSQVGHASSR